MNFGDETKAELIRDRTKELKEIGNTSTGAEYFARHHAAGVAISAFGQLPANLLRNVL